MAQVIERERTHPGLRTRERTRILLAEDDADIREFLSLVLEAEGFEVITMADGLEALNYLSASGRPNAPLPYPDVVISDIQMPGYSGFDLVAGMADRGQSTPVILITGLVDDETRAEAARVGASHLLHKPIDLDRLTSTIRGVVEA